MIQQIVQQTGGSIRKVCAVLGEPRSSFYGAATPTATLVADTSLGELIKTVFRRHRQRYGYSATRNLSRDGHRRPAHRLAVASIGFRFPAEQRLKEFLSAVRQCR